MGFFSYECPKCNTNIRSNYSNGEDAILFHLRAGKVLGYGLGMYNGYGRVVPDGDFRNNKEDNPNSHQEVIKSEYKLEDSGVSSGIAAYHLKCFDIDSDLNNLIISKYDPEQGYGTIRKKFSNTPYEKLEDIKKHINISIKL